MTGTALLLTMMRAMRRCRAAVEEVRHRCSAYSHGKRWPIWEPSATLMWRQSGRARSHGARVLICIARSTIGTPPTSRPVGERNQGTSVALVEPRDGCHHQEAARDRSLRYRGGASRSASRVSRIAVRNMPGIPTYGYIGFVGWDEYYWTNWPGAKTPIPSLIPTGAHFKYMTPFLEPTGGSSRAQYTVSSPPS